MVHLCSGTTSQKRHEGIFWKAGSFVERLPYPLLKIKFGRFLQVLWRDISTEWMLSLGPGGGLKAFCSRTVHLQFIMSIFQRAEADGASHRFQHESSTQTNVCRFHCQLLSHKKKLAWGAGSETQET